MGAYLEPEAGIRMMTATIRQFYNGLVEAGFDHESAIMLTNTWTAVTFAVTEGE